MPKKTSVCSSSRPSFIDENLAFVLLILQEAAFLRAISECIGAALQSELGVIKVEELALNDCAQIATMDSLFTVLIILPLY